MGLVSVSGGGKRKEAFMLLVVFKNISRTQRYHEFKVKNEE